MSKYFDGEMLSGYEESPITITNLETDLLEQIYKLRNKQINELKGENKWKCM